MVKLKRIYTAHISTSHITKHKSRNLCFASQLIYVRHRWYSDTHFFLTNVLLKFHLHRLLLPFSFITLLLSLIYLSLCIHIYIHLYVPVSSTNYVTNKTYIYVFIYVTYIYIYIYMLSSVAFSLTFLLFCYPD